MKAISSFKKIGKIYFLVMLLLLVAGAAVAQTVSPGGTVQSKYSRIAPVLDSNINASEWDDARIVTQNIDLLDWSGKVIESHPLVLYIKNDSENLYIAGNLSAEEQDGTMQGSDLNSLILDCFVLAFDNNDDGSYTAGEDKKSLYILNQSVAVHDEHLLTAAEQQAGTSEGNEQQNISGKISYSSNSQAYSFEVAIPLNSGDSNDVSIQPGQNVRWNLFFLDKFNFKYTGMSVGGLTASSWATTTDWSYIQLATPPTMRDIHVFAAVMNYSDLDTANLEFVGSHYDFVLTSFPEAKHVQPMRSQNPDLPIFLFNNPYFTFGDEFWWASSGSEYNFVVNKYALKDPNDQIVGYGGPIYGGLEHDQSIPLMDIRNTAWQDYFAAQTRKYVELSGLNGVFLDTLEERIPHFATYGGTQYPKNYSAEQWKDSIHQFLTKVKGALSGTQAKVIFNGISRSPGTPSGIRNQSILDQVDGGAIETYSIVQSMDVSNQTKNWYFHETIMKDLRQARDQGKWIIMEAYGDQDSEQVRLYALCSFLMVQNDHTFFYFTRKDQAGGLHWRPEWDTKIGKPLGSFNVLGNGAYERDFEKGKALVNPTNTTLVVTGLSAYNNWKGQAVSSVSLPPYSGALLVNRN